MTSRPCLAILAPALLLLAAVGCGGDSGAPSAPSPAAPAPAAPTTTSGVANISGAWFGTSDFEQNNVHSIASIAMTLTQTDRAVSGTLTYTAADWQGWTGTINGTVAGTSGDTQFVGTIALRSPSLTGTGTCGGEAVFSGRSVSDSLNWSAASLNLVTNTPSQPASACRGLLRNLLFILGRR
jgi:hypothetical protein